MYSFYNPEYTIISEDIGGKLKHSFFANIIYLHATIETEKFLKDVGIEYTKKTQLIKYYKNNKITQDIDINDKINIIRKKLDDIEFNPIDLNLSTNDYYIDIFEINYNILIEKLSKNIKIITEKVIRITDKNIITENSRYEYSHIVSSLPADVFNKLYYKPRQLEFKSKPVTFVLTDKCPHECLTETFDMLYILDLDKKYVRISKKPGERNSNIYLYEFTGRYTKEDIITYLPEGSNILEYYIDYRGIIYTNKNNFAPTNILFIGRFALWEHSLKQQDILKEAQFDYDFRTIFSRQGYFTSQLIDFNLLNTIDNKEKLTKDYILHLTAELGEVLNELNYKQHKAKKIVNSEKVKEELIDIQKYLLNLFLVWGVSTQEFVKLFNDKSYKVEQRYEQEIHGK